MNQKNKILIDQTRLITGHKARGSGRYITNLIDSIKKQNTVDLVDSYGDFPQIVHFPYFDPFFLTLPARFLLPTVITVHDLIPIDHPNFFPKGVKASIKWQIQKLRLKKANAIITDSEYSKTRIAALTGIEVKKIFSIPLAADKSFTVLDKSALLPIRKKYNLPEKFILYLGDINPNKNVINLIKAAQKFQYPLFLAGRAFGATSKKLDEIKLLISKSKNSKIIGEIESTNDLVAIYNLAYLTVVPSWDEGFGFPILESMACGTPVATSKVSCLPEVGGTAAIYFDPYSIEDISQKVNKIINLTRVQYQSLVQKSIDNNTQFTWEKTAKKTIDVYNQIIPS